MTKESFTVERALLGQLGLALIPETVRREFLSDSDYLHELDLISKTKGTATFAPNAKFDTCDLYDAVVKSDAEGTSQTIKSHNDEEWALDIREKDALACIYITKDDTTFRHSEGMILVGDKERRLAALRVMTEHVCLPRKDIDAWEKKVDERPLTLNEFSVLHEDLRDTPISFSKRLANAIRDSETPLDLFIPETERYLARLVGPLGDSKNLSEHILHGAAQRLAELVQWNSYDGLLFSLLMGAHTDAVSKIPLDGITDETLIAAAQTISESGDLISKLAFIQVAMQRIKSCPDLIEPAEHLVDNLMTMGADDDNDAYADLSRLFIFIESEFSVRGVFRNFPPFYRRMASFAQASLIQRVLLLEGVEPASLHEWIQNNSVPQYLAQTVVDLRQEPRWQPEGIDEVQLRQEFIGRLLNSGHALSDEIKGTRLEHTLSASLENKVSIAKYAEFPKPYFPGPLEGHQEYPTQALPDDVKLEFEKQLSMSGISEKTFVVPINFSTLVTLDKEIPTKIAEKLAHEKFQLHSINSTQDVAATILGLGKVACITRSLELANAVRVLVRKYRSDTAHKLSISEASRAVVMAAASQLDQNQWNTFIADSFDELTLGELTKKEAQTLHAFLHNLTLAEPSLWTVIGRSDAALTSFLLM